MTMCVFGYLPESMEIESWATCSDGRGHQRSFKVIIQVISRDNGNLAWNFDQVCVWYHWKGYLSGNLTNGYWDAGSGRIGHHRLSKVTNQGRLKR